MPFFSLCEAKEQWLPGADALPPVPELPVLQKPKLGKSGMLTCRPAFFLLSPAVKGLGFGDPGAVLNVLPPLHLSPFLPVSQYLLPRMQFP